MTSLIGFGDSLCDGGNAYALRGDAAFPCPPHWLRRRCDGPVGVEPRAPRLAPPPLPPPLAGRPNPSPRRFRPRAGGWPLGRGRPLEAGAL